MNWVPYTGERYSRNSQNTVEFTGLYGQTFAQNNYSWQDVSDVSWRDPNGTIQTLLDAFTEKSNPYVLTQDGTPGTLNIYHYKQGLNGKYSTAERYAATRSNSGTFYFSNKFHGFTVKSYNTGNNAFNENGGNAIPSSGSASVYSTLHVYHERNKYELTFANYRTENNSPGQPNDWVIANVPYEKPLSEVIAENPSLMTPPARANYDFAGWYLDAGCTREADFSEEIMPAANMIVYAKWELKKYIVEIDPDGGEMQAGNVFSAYTELSGDGTEITYERVQYGNSVLQPTHIDRQYAPAHNGEYVYVNVRLAPTIAEAAANWSKRLPEQYRGAFYCRLTDLDTVYDTYFADLQSGGNQLLTREQFMAYCVDNTQRYRKIDLEDEVERYVLEGWHKVNADGTTSAEPYHFGDPVTQNTVVRAVWKKAGAYYLQYDPYDSRYDVGRDVMLDDHLMHNMTLYDPSDPNDPAAMGLAHYHDHAQAIILQHPTYIPAHYIFRGWQLMTETGEETGQFYSPGEAFIVDSSYADNHGIIHFEAAYDPESESVRIVDTAALILDANTGAGGYVVRGDMDIYESSVFVDLDNDSVVFKDQPNNFKVHLSEYYNNFRNAEGYLLLGWNRTPDPGNYIPEYAADAVIGIDINDTDDNPNILYAVWEPMYYLTLENHSTDYNITFNLRFTGYDDTVYTGNNNSVLSQFVREEFKHGYSDDDNIISVVQNGTANFDVTIKKAPSSDAPTSIKLVLPQGAGAGYVVSGNLSGVKKDDNTLITASGNRQMFSVYNSGGSSEQLKYNTSSGRWRNLANKNAENYSVNGSMKLGSEGQKVAFYTGTVETVNLYIQGLYYDINSTDENKWVPATEGHGPDATLNFADTQGLTVATYDGTTGITGVSIIKSDNNTFSVNQSFNNTSGYKFIGWYEKDSAAPGDITIDGKSGLDGASYVRNIPVPNTWKNYYALYVPKADGDLVITHDKKDTSIGYAKMLSITATYKNGSPVTNEMQTDDHTVPVHTQISIPVSETDIGTAQLQIVLGVRSGYGSVHSHTFEGTHQLESDPVQQTNKDMNVYLDPSDPNSPYEGKSLWTLTVTKSAAELFEDSDTVKGLKVLRPINYYSDFERKYEFIYNYIFRDGVTPRKYLLTGSTSEHNSIEDFKRFVTESAPYVTNYGENLSWNTATIRVENLQGKGKITAKMDAAQYRNAKANVYVHSYGTTITETWSIDAGSAFPADNRPTAPLIIETGSDTKLQFYRWKITEREMGSAQSGSKLVGYCYFNEFTFMVWDDYDIEPEYVEMQDEEYVQYYPDDENEAYVNIDFLKNTRNQWVDLQDDNVNIKYDENGNAKYNDVLISDYSIIFIDHGRRIKSYPDEYDVGLLYEVVGEVNDEGVTETESDYSPTDAATREAVINRILQSSKDNGTVKMGGKTKFYYSKFDPSGLTHDNRIEFYRGIDNLRSENGELNPNAKYVFNVYAYMKTKDGSIYQSESVPVQLYDLAIRTSISG